VRWAQEEGFKLCLDTRNNEALRFHLASCPEHLSIQLSTNLPYYYYYLRHLTDFWTRKKRGLQIFHHISRKKKFEMTMVLTVGSSMLPKYISPIYVPIAKISQVIDCQFTYLIKFKV
jgi:hypothetical protein